MKRKKINIRVLIIANMMIVAVSVYLVTKVPVQKRGISSVEEESQFIDQVSLSWQQTNQGLVINLSDNKGSICHTWSSMDIVFRAEGIAYSGEADRVVQTSLCENGQFQQTWVSHLTEVQGDNYQKIGLFIEEPPQWVLEQIILEGAGGVQILSAQDIHQRYNRIPSMIP